MSARMWKVREALMQPATDKADYDRRVAALAEVEEWEAEVQRLGDDVAEQALRIIDLGQKENEAVARAEAAEAERDEWIKATADNGAEADRLKAALDELLQWAAAVAPADRNTEEVP